LAFFAKKKSSLTPDFERVESLTRGPNPRRLQIVRPVSCLIVVDVQNDFISGSLAISNCPAGHDGLEVSREGHVADFLRKGFPICASETIKARPFQR
jgi:hypothetical protein